jgi:hypothetical protein
LQGNSRYLVLASGRDVWQGNNGAMEQDFTFG